MLTKWILLLLAGSKAIIFGYWLYTAWRDQNWWPEHVAEVQAWERYFKENVASGWLFYDGKGY